MYIIAPWGEYGGIDEDAWLGFWGTLLSATAAAVVAMRILAAQARDQAKNLDRQLEEQATQFTAQLEKQEEHHLAQMDVQRRLQEDALTVQRDEARKEREILALTEIVSIIYEGLASTPTLQWAQGRDGHSRRFSAAVAKWKMNWGFEYPDEDSFDLTFMSSAEILLHSYLQCEDLGEYEPAVQEMQLAFFDFSISAGNYALKDKDTRLAIMSAWNKRFDICTNQLLRDYPGLPPDLAKDIWA